MSPYDLVGTPTWVQQAPLSIRRALFDLVDRFKLDPVYAPPINAFRAELGLNRPARRIKSRWLHSPQRVIALFPDWFAAPAPDWPPHTVSTGFVLHDTSATTPMSAALAAFLRAGRPPIVFTRSTALPRGGGLPPGESLAAARMVGVRAVIFVAAGAAPPAPPADDFITVTSEPHARLFPACRAVVHQGLIGNAAQAMAAGLPQLSVPLATDQPGTAQRLQRLGVARTLDRRDYRAANIATAIRELIWSESVARRCEDLARRVNQARPIEQICPLVEELAGQEKTK